MREVIHIEEMQQRSKAADIFGFAIARRWSVPSEEARAWVERDFLNPRNDVLAAMADGKIRAVLCVGPLSEAGVPDVERALLCEQLGEPLFVTGLAVVRNWEHRKLARAVHDQLRQDMQDWGFSSAVAGTASFAPSKPLRVPLATLGGHGLAAPGVRPDQPGTSG